MTSKQIVSAATKLYTGRYSVSFLQFLLFLSWVGAGIMLFLLLVTLIFPGMAWGFNRETYIMAAVGAGIVFIMYLIYLPYVYGGVWYIVTAVAVTNVPPAALFGCYTDPARIVRVLRLEALLALRKAVVLIPILLICLVQLLFTIRVMSVTEGILPIAAAGGCILSFAGLFMLYKVYALRFFAARFVFLENPYQPAGEIIRRSLALTKGHSNLLAAVYLRILPLSVLTIALLPAVFTLPIQGASYAYTYRELSQ